MMKRATPLHLAVDRSQAPPVPLVRRLWSYIVHWLRPSLLGPDPAGGPGAPVVSSPSSLIPDAATQPEPAPPPQPQPDPPTPLPAATTAPPPAPALPDAPTDGPAAPPPVPEAGEAGLQTFVAITETTATIAGHPPRATPLITVVAIAPGWSALLARSVGSVLRQSYSSWELVIVDTSAPAQPPPLVAAGDGRIRVVSAAGLTDDAARGRGLEAAQGQLLTWLHPGAVMAPGWLRGLAWAAGEWPGTDLFIGIGLAFVGEVPDQPPVDLVGLYRSGRVGLTPAGREDDLTLLARRRQPTHAAAAVWSSADRAPRWGEGDRQLISVVAAVSRRPES